MMKSLATLTAFAVSLFGAATVAQAAEIYESPASWRLQSYLDTGNIAVYFTSVSACTYGGLFLSTASEDQKGRFWSIILTAKASNKKVGIFYTGCNIDSFYIEN